MALIRTTTPQPLAITLEDARSHLLSDAPSDKMLDEKITRALASATEHCATQTSIAIAVAKYEKRLACWPACRTIELPIAPVRSIESVKYRDVNEVVQTVAPSSYAIDVSDRTCWLRFASTFSAPTTSRLLPLPIVITLSAGFDAFASESADRDIYRCPPELRNAVLLRMEREFEAGAISADAIADLERSVASLLDNVRRIRVA